MIIEAIKVGLCINIYAVFIALTGIIVCMAIRLAIEAFKGDLNERN